MSLRLPAAAAALAVADECRNDPGGYDGPDTGAGGGEVSSPDQTDAHVDPADSDPPAAPVAADDDDDDEELKDETHASKAYREDPDFRRLMNKARRLQRQAAKHRPLVEKARALGIAESMDEIVHKARTFDQMQPLLQSERFRRLIAEPDEPAESARREPDPPAFDDSDFPFDHKDPGGAYLHRTFHGLHEQNLALRQALSDVTKRLSHIERGTQAEHQNREIGGWRTALDAAAAKVPENIAGYEARQAFRDAVIGAFHQARQRGVRLDPNKVIAHYLKGLPPKTRAAASAAAQRIAEGNKSLPRPQSFIGGAPASARDGRKRETVRDVNRRLLGRMVHT